MTGTLADTTPAGVLQVLSSRGSTGAVRFLGDSGCTVYLYRGELYFAENVDTAEDLAVALVRPDRLSAEEWDGATAAGYPTETVGDELVETGAITRELLASVVLSVIYDPLIALFRAPVGAYEFAPDVLHWVGPYRTFDVDAIVSEVRRRTREADEMTPIVPSLEAVVRSARTLPEQHGSVNLRRDDWEVVVAAAHGPTVSELAVELGRGRWSTARLVYRLANADLLTVTVADAAALSDTESAEPAVSPEPSFGFLDDDGAPPLDDAEDPWGFAEDVDAEEPADTWSIPLADDIGGETAADDELSDQNDWSGGLSAVPDELTEDGAAPEGFGAPELHPDIAKALAESTYADSATAINAMAARLGAIDAADDDDDDWDTGVSENGTGDEFWSPDSGTSQPDDFIWKPAVWETSGEATPLPQRGGARATAQRESGDPVWLDNLYSEFMPGGEEGGPDGESVGEAAEDAKPKGLRRLLSAIRRL